MIFDNKAQEPSGLTRQQIETKRLGAKKIIQEGQRRYSLFILVTAVQK